MCKSEVGLEAAEVAEAALPISPDMRELERDVR